MEIEVVEKGESTTVILKGDIFVEQAEELRDVFDFIAAKSPREVVIDTAELKSITSSGIGKIVLLYKGLQRKGGRIKIINVNDTIMQIFKIVKLDKFVELVGM
jgi:anti-anti-sigma factor